ncbi:MAG TPA: hypothetical protein VK806_14340 [Bacteroidia bacterium]|nr:hypothetical protein [Bacteroidia bacterium]
MRKLILLFSAILAFLSTNTQAQNAKPRETIYDTVRVRLNNKPFYTIRENGRWQIEEGEKITFYPVKADDSTIVELKCLSNKADLVKMLRHGDTISNYFLADLKLSFNDFTDEVQKKKAVSNTFSHRLIFFNCVFGPVTADTIEDQYEEDTKQKKKIEFKQDVMFVNCNFVKGLEISNCVFDKKFIMSGQILGTIPSVVENCEFHGICYIFGTPSDAMKGNPSLSMNLCKFSEPFIFSIIDNEKSRIVLERCKFSSVVSLGKSIPPNLFMRFHEMSQGAHYLTRIYNYASSYATFLKTKYTKEYYLTDDTVQQFTHNDRMLYNLSILKCQAMYVDIANTNLSNCLLEDVTVTQCIDITSCNFSYSPTFTGKQALEDINFPNTHCVIYANYKSFSPDAFKLGNYLEKISIHPLVHNFYDSTSNFMEDNDNFYNLIKDYAGKRFTNQDMVNSVKARYEHEKSMWALEYHAAHLKHSTGFGDRLANFFPWVGGHFLEITVSSGYKGEWKFAIWVLIIILTFTFFYYFRHRDAVIDYLNSKFNKDLDKIENYSTLKIYGPHNKWRDFGRCLWFSTMVFVDPRLPISFFNLKSGFFGMVLLQWIFGLIAIMLFLVFLASNYAFIRTMIGI